MESSKFSTKCLASASQLAKMRFGGAGQQENFNGGENPTERLKCIKIWRFSLAFLVTTELLGYSQGNFVSVIVQSVAIIMKSTDYLNWFMV